MSVYGVIYLITCLVTGKLYVGQTTQRLKKRIDVHKFGDLYIDREIQKYGWTAETFKVEILEECYSREQLNEREKFWIKELDCKYPNGYNKTSGGKGTDGHRCSDETRARKSESTTGEKNPFFGRHHSDEMKAASSAEKRGESPYKNLLAEMTKLLLSYHALAKLLGISQASMSFKMSGKRRFTVKEVAKLEKIFNKSAEYLLERDDGKNFVSNRYETPYKNLLALMEAKKMSYTDLAKLLGVSRPTISDKIRGKYRFNSKEIAKLEQIFGLSAKYILARDDGKENVSTHYETPYKNLLAEIDNHNLSYSNMAKLLGVSPSVFSAKMRGKRNFTAKDKAKLEEIFQKPIEYLLERTAD